MKWNKWMKINDAKKLHDYYGADNMKQSKQIKKLWLYMVIPLSGCQVGSTMCMIYEAIKEN
jgi:hypothetical protein